MAYVTVPKRFDPVKSKIVFGLTKRQLICFWRCASRRRPALFFARGRVTGSAAAPDYGVRHAAGLPAGPV